MAENGELSSYVFCTYMDILGDTLKHLELESNPNRERLISKWKKTREEMLKYSIEGEAFLGANWSFSDSFIYVAHVPFSRRKDVWSNMFKSCVSHSALVFLHMMKSDSFIRGGIGQGVAFVDEQHFIGKPLVDAYLTESTIAKYPVVALSKRTEMFFLYRKKNKKFGAFCDGHLLRIVGQKSFGEDLIVVNPFSEEVIDEYCEKFEIKDKSSLKRRLSGKLASRLHRFEFDQRVYEKYSFLRDLWNYSQGTGWNIPKSCQDRMVEFEPVRKNMKV